MCRVPIQTGEKKQPNSTTKNFTLVYHTHNNSLISLSIFFFKIYRLLFFDSLPVDVVSASVVNSKTEKKQIKEPTCLLV